MLDTEVDLWGLNFTYDPPSVVGTVPATLPADGGSVTVIGENFGSDANYIQVLIDGQSQGSVSNPRRHPNGLLEMVVAMSANEEGVAKLVVTVGQSASKPFTVVFRQIRPHPQLLLRIGGVLAAAVVCLVLLLGSRRHWEGLDSAANQPRARPGGGRGKRGFTPSLKERLIECKEEDLSEGLEEHNVHMIKRHHLVLHSKIARGAFGNVFKGSWLGTVCAVKQVLPRPSCFWDASFGQCRPYILAVASYASDKLKDAER